MWNVSQRVIRMKIVHHVVWLLSMIKPADKVVSDLYPLTGVCIDQVPSFEEGLSVRPIILVIVHSSK